MAITGDDQVDMAITADDLEDFTSRMGIKYGGERLKIIIGIDYGTTYSGVSYVTSDKSGVEDINIISTWPGTGKDVPGTWKTPTRIAYRTENPELNGNKWGFEVGPKLRSYSWTKLLLDRHAETGDFDDPALKDLAGTGLMRLPDHRNAQGVCQDFLSEIYTYTVTLLKKQITPETFNVTPMECWITLPAIWSDQAKHATLSAAKAAGFGSRPMDVINTIAEPEAAAIATLKKYIGPKSLNSVKPGEHILICDCGGGTVDITTYTINKTTPRMEFSELCVGVGGKCGATYIDRNLHQLMSRRFGSSFNDLPFEAKGPGSRFMKSFEGIKGDIGYSDDETVKEIGPINLRLEDSEYYDSDYRMVRLTKQDMQSLFQPVVIDILGLVSQQVKYAKAKKEAMINRIILVGGFGDSPYLNKALVKFCKDKGGIRLMCPEHCQAAVVRGAALRGLEGTAPTIKQCRYHYGFSWAIKFRPGIDKEENAYIDDFGGKKYVRGIMNWVIKKGEEVTNSTARIIEITRAHKSGDELIHYTDLYSSSLETPQKRIEEARIKKIGRIRSDFSQVDISQFECRWNSKISKSVYELTYQLEVRFGEEKGVLDFRIVVNGKVIGKADIEYAGN
ncbi:hypothetical protein MMC22_005066 [Lobaria immixta]|nr:hypothetical protein [Lobaria immixta]